MSNFAALSISDITNAGFKPLQKASTFNGRSFDNRKSFDSRYEETKIQQQSTWASNPWKAVVKTASFSAEISPQSDPINEAVVIVDPFSTGALLAKEVVKSGRRCVRVFSVFNSPVAGFISESIGAVSYDATIQHDDRLLSKPEEAAEETITQLKKLPWKVVAILPGAETGVELAELLSVRLNVLNNGEEFTFARRNKYAMGETVRKAGIRAVNQCKATKWEDIELFLSEWNPNPFAVVVKPIQSAGSDDVFKCINIQEVKTAFDKINGAINGLGVINEGVLVQEFLDGIEYVIDSVSRDGVHKTVTLWEYDKRAANDTNFVYFGTYLRPTDSELAQTLIKYSDSVLDALGIMNGPGHMEVKMCADGPCLVEVGSRCHGGEGTWIPVAEACLGKGYNQMDAALDCYVRPAAFDALPTAPGRVQKYGAEIDLVSFKEGIIKSIPGIDKIRSLPSFQKMELAVQPGVKQLRTTDCFTRPGSVVLINEDEAVLKADVQVLRDLEQNGLFEFE